MVTEARCTEIGALPFVESSTWNPDGDCDDPDNCAEESCCDWNGYGYIALQILFAGQPHRCSFREEFQMVVVEDTPTKKVWEYEDDLACGDYMAMTIQCNKLRPTGVPGKWEITNFEYPCALRVEITERLDGLTCDSPGEFNWSMEYASDYCDCCVPKLPPIGP